MIEKLIWKIKWNRFAIAYEIKSALLEARIKVSRMREKHYKKIISKLGAK